MQRAYILDYTPKQNETIFRFTSQIENAWRWKTKKDVETDIAKYFPLNYEGVRISGSEARIEKTADGRLALALMLPFKPQVLSLLRLRSGSSEISL